MRRVSVAFPHFSSGAVVILHNEGMEGQPKCFAVKGDGGLGCIKIGDSLFFGLRLLFLFLVGVFLFSSNTDSEIMTPV